VSGHTLKEHPIDQRVGIDYNKSVERTKIETRDGPLERVRFAAADFINALEACRSGCPSDLRRAVTTIVGDYYQINQGLRVVRALDASNRAGDELFFVVRWN
jgi:hypothetical protein